LQFILLSKILPITSLDRIQVKTTQPRRYLVRPNQGLIQPGQAAIVQIMLVDKDKHQLLESYKSLGRAALDQCKDKFLVQSVAVSRQRALELQSYDSITELWTSTSTAVANKKLHVRHTVTDAVGTGRTAAVAAPAPSSFAPLADMTKEQMTLELSGLRRKYDELVAFSVNLTAERDMLSNTLELTKRDLHRALTNKSAAPAVAIAPKSKSSSSSVGIITVFILVLVAFGMGAMVQQLGYVPSVMGPPPAADVDVPEKQQEL
jgi:MSP (Major sperm protein) domain